MQAFTSALHFTFFPPSSWASSGASPCRSFERTSGSRHTFLRDASLGRNPPVYSVKISNAPALRSLALRLPRPMHFHEESLRLSLADLELSVFLFESQRADLVSLEERELALLERRWLRFLSPPTLLGTMGSKVYRRRVDQEGRWAFGSHRQDQPLASGKSARTLLYSSPDKQDSVYAFQKAPARCLPVPGFSLDNRCFSAASRPQSSVWCSSSLRCPFLVKTACPW